MSLTLPAIVGLLLILLILPLAICVANWRTHARRRRAAQTRGWHYFPRGAATFLRGHYSLAGTLRGRYVWELHRRSRHGHFRFIWSAPDARLRYGAVYIVPRRSPALAQLRDEPGLRVLNHGGPQWRAEYSLLTSHEQLGRRHLTPALERDLLAWPAWPAPGALEVVIWDVDRLEVHGRYVNDWRSVDRLIALGERLVATLPESAPRPAAAPRPRVADIGRP